MDYDVVIIGGGAAGLAAAIGAKKQGADKVLILEKENYLGGILNQCIHNGFGKYLFNKEVTGPEYASIFIEEVKKLGIEYKTKTMVLEIDKNKKILAVNGKEGVIEIQCKALVLAMGCREKTRGVAKVSGSAFAGVFTAGMVQRLINLEGVMPGKEVVILGSGDLGLIMAKRLTLEGAKVKAVIENLSYCGGLEENYYTCLKNFNIPLKLKYTITDITGKERVNGVTIARVDDNKRVIKGTEEFICCDTVVLSVGLVPDGELFKNMGLRINGITGGTEVDESMQSNIEGVFSAGNIVHLHDYVDDVTREGFLAGKSATKYVLEKLDNKKSFKVSEGRGISYILPKIVHIGNIDENVEFKFRSSKEYENVKIRFSFGDNFIEIHKKKVIPSKMEVITLSKEELLKNYREDKVLVEICEK